MYTINLVIGDWSGDGHEIRETITIQANLDVHEIGMTYKKGVKICGIDLKKDVCSVYEDSSISPDIVSKLEEFGLPSNLAESLKDKSGLDPAYSIISVEPEQFAKLYLFIVSLGNPNFSYEIVNNATINIGGYGLFS